MPDTLRLTEIDASNIGVHPRLTIEDQCLFLFEYTSGKNWQFSQTNGLINTLKRKPGAKGQYYKDHAITRLGAQFRATLNETWLADATLVPAPPSKAVGHPEYDPRMERICKAIRPGLDVRCIVRQTESKQAFHEAGGTRPSVEDLLAIYEIDESKCQPTPTKIAIVDDVLTAGTHFRALDTKLRGRFPGVPVTGLFVARRIFPPEHDDDFGW